VADQGSGHAHRGAGGRAARSRGRGHFVTPKKLFSKWGNTLGQGQQRPEKGRFLMSLKKRLFACFSSEMLCLSELRNVLEEDKQKRSKANNWNW